MLLLTLAYLGGALTIVSPRILLLDGQPPGADHGADIDVTGVGAVDGHRLYQLTRQKDPARERVFEIEFFDPGVQTFAFTFG